MIERRKLEFSRKVRKCIRKCKEIGEIAVMEVSEVGVRTRARSMADEGDGSTKRRKVDSGELQFPSSYVKLKSRRRVVITPERPISPAISENSGRVIQAGSCSSFCSDQISYSRCSSNGSSELVKDSTRSVDLEVESPEIENSAYFNSRERRETTPSSEVSAESDELESTARPSEANSRHRSTAAKMPSEAEIEEFFSAVEKDQKKRFIEKYNYDILKDVPLEGRYEWVRLKP